MAVGKKIGRPCECTPEIQDKVIAALKVGVHRCVAARHAGVRPDRLSIWLKQFPDFRKAVQEAEAGAEIVQVQNLYMHAAGDWKAGLEWLQRKFPERWAKADRQVMRELRDALAEAQTVLAQLKTAQPAAATPPSPPSDPPDDSRPGVVPD